VLVSNYNLSVDFLSKSGSNPLEVTKLEVLYSSDNIFFNGFKVEDMAFVSFSNTSYGDFIYEGSEVGDQYP